MNYPWEASITYLNSRYDLKLWWYNTQSLSVAGDELMTSLIYVFRRLSYLFSIKRLPVIQSSLGSNRERNVCRWKPPQSSKSLYTLYTTEPLCMSAGAHSAILELPSNIHAETVSQWGPWQRWLCVWVDQDPMETNFPREKGASFLMNEFWCCVIKTMMKKKSSKNLFFWTKNDIKTK